MYLLFFLLLSQITLLKQAFIIFNFCISKSVLLCKLLISETQEFSKALKRSKGIKLFFNF